MSTLRIIRPNWNNKQEASDRVGRAKKYPIEKMYEGRLRRVGRVLMGVCPFHQEDTASFAVYPEQNTWYCFAEGIGGDAISFYMKQTGKSFIDAVSDLDK